MKKAEKLNVLNKPAVAYWSGCGGIEIKSIEYGIDDYVVFVAGAWCSETKSAHKARIYYNGNGAFFRYNGYTIPLSDCIRCDM